MDEIDSFSLHNLCNLGDEFLVVVTGCEVALIDVRKDEVILVEITADDPVVSPRSSEGANEIDACKPACASYENPSSSQLGHPQYQFAALSLHKVTVLGLDDLSPFSFNFLLPSRLHVQQQPLVLDS